MVTISNGRMQAKVTRSAYEEIFKKQGFNIIDESKMADSESVSTPAPTNKGKKSEDEVELEQILSKPVSSWNKSELKFVARMKNIDISGASTVSEVKEIIKEALGM